MDDCGDTGGPIRNICMKNIIEDTNDDCFVCTICGISFDHKPVLETREGEQPESSTHSPVNSQRGAPMESTIDWEKKGAKRELQSQEGDIYCKAGIIIPPPKSRPKNWKKGGGEGKGPVGDTGDKDEEGGGKLIPRLKNSLGEVQTFTSIQKTKGKANQILGLTGNGVPRWEVFNPPFSTKESLLHTGRDMDGEKPIEVPMGALVKIIHDSRVPRRKYFLKENLCGIGLPSRGQTRDNLHQYTRVAIELFLYAESISQMPLFFNEINNRCNLQPAHVDKVLCQGGVMSREMGEQLKKQNLMVCGDFRCDWFLERIDNFLHYMSVINILKLSDEEKGNISSSMESIFESIYKHGLKVNGVNWVSKWISDFCAIKFQTEENCENSGFWWISDSWERSEKLPMRVTAVTYGLILAQSLSEVMLAQSSSKILDEKKKAKIDSVLRLVDEEMRWIDPTGSSDIRKSWLIMMNCIDKESVWPLRSQS